MPPIPKAVSRQAACWQFNAPVECSGRDDGSADESRFGVAERLINGTLGGPATCRTAQRESSLTLDPGEGVLNPGLRPGTPGHGEELEPFLDEEIRVHSGRDKITFRRRRRVLRRLPATSRCSSDAASPRSTRSLASSAFAPSFPEGYSRPHVSWDIRSYMEERRI
jgi:hypothetical protein